MLFTGTVESRTFEILGKLCRDARLNAFNLAGGTALALHLGHRLSIDLDMFSAQSFNSSNLSEHLISEYGLNISNIANNTINYKGVYLRCQIRPHHSRISPCTANRHGPQRHTTLLHPRYCRNETQCNIQKRHAPERLCRHRSRFHKAFIQRNARSLCT